jgi:hypothetical protein
MSADWTSRRRCAADPMVPADPVDRDVRATCAAAAGRCRHLVILLVGLDPMAQDAGQAAVQCAADRGVRA